MEGLPNECTGSDELLRQNDFKCKERFTDSNCGWREYTKAFRKQESNVMLQLVLRFELVVHDDPNGSYDENHELSFDRADLEIFDRQMIPIEGLPIPDIILDEETESLRRIDRYPIHLKSFDEIHRITQMIRE